MENLKVENVIIPFEKESSENVKKLKEIATQKNINLIIATSGKRLNIENNVYFDILAPNKNDMINENSINNNSIVFKLNYKSFSMLFTGDIEEEKENKLLKEYSENTLKSTVLKVAHHGSNSSSTEAFIKAVNPKISLIGVGENNKYNHPSFQTLKVLENSKIFRTDKNGEVLITVKR